MIRIFGDYYDKHGNRYKVVSFNGGKYACESAKTGKVSFFSPSELLSKPPLRTTMLHQQPTIVKREELVAKEEPKEEVSICSAPVYEEPVYEQPVYEEPVKEIKKFESPTKETLKDNIKETADNDFYADF